ncbi:MAG: hypothetical protein MJZ33_04355 [Paludibacteraceae bacterium]|nr:hypothetical protein [Paludibacteraceae bacterium]
MNRIRKVVSKQIQLIAIVIGCLSVCNSIFAQKNIDTPNLDFSQGEAGWTYQTGWYTTPLKGSPSEVTYVWDKTSVGDSKTIAEVNITASRVRTLTDEEKSRFWRFDNPHTLDGKFAFLPLYVLPKENQSGVMRIGRPDPWIPDRNVTVSYSMEGSLFGPNTVDSDGNKLNYSTIEYTSSNINAYDAGCETYAFKSISTRTDWHNPYYTGSSANPWAGAERMFYDFKVTENSTLLIYRFLAVLSSPETSKNHSENGYPEMVVNILAKNENTGKWERVPCGEHHLIASSNNKELNYPGMEPMFPNSKEGSKIPFVSAGYGEGTNKAAYISDNCNRSNEHNSSHKINNTSCFIVKNCIQVYDNTYVSRFHYSGWRTRYADLRNYVGKTIRVEVLNHDCLMNDSHNSTVIAGGHSSYGYFQAETQKMEIKTNSYEEDGKIKVELIAPEGFPAESYSWFRQSGRTIDVDVSSPNVAYVDSTGALGLIDGESCICRINMDPKDTRGESELELSTSFSRVPVLSNLQTFNEDTPNLDFSQGESGWTYQTGWYTTPLKASSSEYTYIWDNTSHGSTSEIPQADITASRGWNLSAEEKSRFWRFENPQSKDRKFSYIPLFVMPKENQSGVMRIGRPDPWQPDKGGIVTYTMKGSMFGPNTVDSDGNKLDYPKIELSKSGVYSYDAGAETSAMNTVERTDWHNPYYLGKSQNPWAGAERMYYDFKVTENSTMLIYRFLAIVSSPEFSKNHLESGQSEMVVNVLVKDEKTGKWVNIPCGEHHLIANPNNENLNYPGMQPMFPTTSDETRIPFVSNGFGTGDNVGVYISDNCNSVSQHANSHRVSSSSCFIVNNCVVKNDGRYTSRYYYSGWKTRCADLREYIGKTVRVEVLNHDCLMNNAHSNTVIAAGHSSYGYFQAETRKWEIRTPVCMEASNPKVKLEAPKGFPVSSYSWKRYSGRPIEKDASAPYVAYIERASVVDGERVTCSINMDSTDKSGCSVAVLDTKLEMVKALPSADIEWKCGGLASFKNTSIITSGVDKISSFYWEFPDGTSSTEKDVTFQFELPNTKYVVRLTAYTSWGCDFTKEIEVITPYFQRNGEVDTARVYVCENEEFTLNAQSSIEGSAYSWFDVTTSAEKSLLAKTSSYTAKNDGEAHVYKVKMKTGACEYVRFFALEPLLKPSVKLATSKMLVCENSSFDLSVENADGDADYLWTGDLLYGGREGASVKLWSSASGSYECKVFANKTYVYDDTYTCRDSASVLVEVQESPSVSLSDQMVCFGDPLLMKAVADPTKPLPDKNSYHWSVNGQEYVKRSNQLKIPAETLYEGENYVRLVAYSPIGCISDTALSFVFVKDRINPSIEGETTVCEGVDVHPVAYPEGATYVWNDNPNIISQKPSFLITRDTTIKVNVTKDGCSEQAILKLHVNQLPNITIEGPDSVVAGSVVKLTALSANNRIVDWSWNASEGLHSQVLSAELSENTNFVVRGVDENGCVNSAEHYVVVTADEVNVTIVKHGSVVSYDGAVHSVTGYDFISSNPKFTIKDLKFIGTAADSTASGTETGVYGMSFTAKSFVNQNPNFPKVNISIIEDSLVIQPCPVVVNVVISKHGETLKYDGLEHVVSGYDFESSSSLYTMYDLEFIGGEKDSVARGTSVGSYGMPFTVSSFRNINPNFSNVNISVVEDSLFILPSFKVDGVTRVCLGSVVNLVASDEGYSYSWRVVDEAGNQILDLTGREIELQPKANVTVYVKAKTTVGDFYETEEQMIPITVLKLPVLSTKEEPVVCTGNDITLHAQGAESLEWKSNGKSGDEIRLQSMTVSRTETLIGTDANGCRSTLDVLITVRPKPSVRLVAPSEACELSTITLRAQGASVYEWDDQSTGENREVRLDATTTYRVYGWDEYGCKGESSKKVWARSAPIIDIKGDSSVCIGESVSVVATSTMPNVTWKWSNDNTTSRFEAKPVENMVATVWAIGNRCTTEKSVNITVRPLPILSIEGRTIICASDTLRLKAGGASSYVWSNGSKGEMMEVANPTSTVYTLKGTDVHKCANSIDVEIKVNELPTLELQGPTLACEGDIVRLSAKSNDCVSYEWSDGSNLNYHDEVAVKGRTYEVKGLDANGCSATASVELNLLPKPVLNVEGEKSVCWGSSIALSVSSSTATDWRWSTGETSSDVSIEKVLEDQMLSVSGTYRVGDVACVSMENVLIKVLPLPSLSTREDPNVCMEGDLTLHAQGAESYIWASNGTENYELILKNVTEDRVEKLMGVGENGCEATIDVPITVRTSPTISILGPDLACEEDFIALQGEGGVRYEWQDNGDTNARHEIQVFFTNTYTLHGWDEYGCRGEATKSLSVKPTPQIYLNGDSIICKGDTLFLEAISTVEAAVWKWSDGATSSTFTQKMDVDTVVTVSAAVGGCVSEKRVNISLLPLPDLRIEGNTMLCKGDELRLVASGASSYDWKNAQDEKRGAVLVDSNPVTSTYKLLGKDSNGCVSEMEIPIKVGDSPLVTIEGPSVACAGDTIRLTAKSNENVVYKWSNGSSADFIDVVIDETQTFELTAVGENGCETIEHKVVKAIKQPILEVVGNKEVCSGSALSLSVTSPTATSWLWSTGEVASSIVLTNVEANQTLWVEGVYEEDGLSCSAKLDIQLMVHENPTISVAEDPIVCSGEDLILHAQGADSYVWTSNGETGAVLNLKNVTTNRIEKLTGIDANGCSSTIDVEVSVLPLPVVKVNAPETICSGDRVTLQGQGASKYEWQDDQSTQESKIVRIDTTSTVVLYGWNEFGCKGETSHKIKVKPLPEISVSGDSVICRGKSIVLAAKSNLTSTTWKWSNGGTSSKYSVNPDSSLIVKVVATTKGCSSEKSINITVHQLPELSVEGKTSLCKDESLSLTASGASSYYWGNLNDGHTDAHYEVAKPNTKTYKVTGTDDNGCVNTLKVPVEVYATPDLSIDGPTIVCMGTEAHLSAVSNACVAYLWGDSSALDHRDVTVKKRTSYSLIGYDGNGCQVKKSKVVDVYPSHQPKIVGETKVCQGATVHLQAQGAVSYIWSDSSTMDYLDAKIDAKQTIKVTGVDEHGCSAVGSITISTMSVPKIGISGDSVVCAGKSVSMRATSNLSSTTWLWNNGATESRITFVPSKDTVISVMATKDVCSSEKIVNVKVNALPQLSVEGDVHVCAGDSVRLLGVGAKDYYWDKVAVNPLVKEVTIPKTFVLKGVDENGCQAEIKVDVETEALPAVKIEGDLLVCKDNTAQLTAVSDREVSYLWNDDNHSTSKSISLIASETQTYKVQVQETSGLHCVGVDSVTVKVLEQPIVSILGESSICEGEILNLEAKVDNEKDVVESYVYSWNVDETNRSATIAFVPTEQSQIVSALVETSNGCIGMAKKVISVKKAPSFHVQGIYTICQGEQLYLEAVPNEKRANYHYFWNDTVVGEVYSQSVWETGNLNVKVKALSEEGCFSLNDEIVGVNVLPTPKLSIEGDQMVCFGAPATLEAHFDTDEETTKLSWYYDYMNEEVTDSMLIIPSVTMPTKVVVSALFADQCESKLETTVVPVEKPMLEIKGDDLPICGGRELSLTASDKSLDSEKTQYVWSVADVMVAQGDSYKAEYNQSTLVHLTAVKDNCSVQKDTLITVYATPDVDFVGDATLCEGDSLHLSATKVAGDGDLKYSWSRLGAPTEVGETFEALFDAGAYELVLKAEDSHGCSSSEKIIPLTVNDRPKVSVPAANDGVVEVCRGESVELEAVGDQETLSYAWGSEESNVIIVPSVEEEKEYTVTVFDGSCYGSATVAVRPKEYPTILVSDLKACMDVPVSIRPKANENVLDYTFKYGDEEHKSVAECILTPTQEESTLYIYPRGVNGCESSIPTEMTITAVTKPVITVDGSLEICQNSTLNLSATVDAPFVSYYWKDEQGNEYDADLSMTLNEGGDYQFLLSVVSTEDMNCSFDSIVKVSVYELPSFEIEGVDEICMGSEASLKAVGGLNLTYKWYDENPEINKELAPLSNADTYLLADVQDTATLYVEADNGYCKSYETHTVIVIAKPELAYTGDIEVCEGSVAMLEADGQDAGVLYAWNDQVLSDYATYNSNEMLVGQNDTVKLTAVRNGCSNETYLVISANPNPQLVVPSKEVYSGEIFTMNYSLVDNGADVAVEKWYSEDQLLGGFYAENLSDTAAIHAWHTSFNTDVTTTMYLRLEVESSKGCTQSLPVEVLVREKVLSGRFLVFNVLGQIIGEVDLDGETPARDQLSFYKSYQVLFLQSLSNEDVLIKVKVRD